MSEVGDVLVEDRLANRSTKRVAAVRPHTPMLALSHGHQLRRQSLMKQVSS
jgi:hypothetical protein